MNRIGGFPCFSVQKCIFPYATDYFACCGETVSLFRPTGNLSAAHWDCFTIWRGRAPQRAGFEKHPVIFAVFRSWPRPRFEPIRVGTLRFAHPTLQPP
jgi:hypothetical protein